MMGVQDKMMKSWQELSWFKRNLINTKAIDPLEHSLRLKERLEQLSDAFLRRSKGATHKAVAASVALRLTALGGTAPAMMGLASLFGTASTGTAISTLSGAAFNSAALAWLGGSVATGTILVSGGTIAAGLGALYLSKKVKFFFDNERNLKDIPEDERVVAEGILGILNRLETQGTSGPMLLSLWQLNLEPMITKITHFTDDRFSDWGWSDLRKLKKAVKQLKKLQVKTEYKLSNVAKFSISAFSATITKLFLEGIKYTKQDELVMEAFRRSTNALSNATPEEIGSYIRQHETLESRQGMLNNVKGIFHEISYAYDENNDGDDWIVELSVKTNEPAVDVWLVNETSGEKIPYQLKATENTSSASAHYEKYPDIQILGNEELAESRDDVESSGFSNSAMEEQVTGTTDKLAEDGAVSQIIEESMTAGAAAAFITYTINLGVELKTGKKISEATADSLKPAKQSFMIGAALVTITELMI